MNVVPDGTDTDIVWFDGERGELVYRRALPNGPVDGFGWMTMFGDATPSMLMVAEVVVLAVGVSVLGRRPYSEMAVPSGQLRLAAA